MNMYDLKDMQREVNIIPVLQGEGLPKVKDSELPDVLPILALRNAVILPGTVYPVTIGRDKSMRLVREAEEKNLFIGALPQKDVSVEEPGKADLYGYGVVARVVKMLEMPDGSVTAILQSFKRFELEDIIQSDPYLVARVHYLDDFVPQIEPSTQKMLSESLREKAGNIIRGASFAPKEAITAMESIDSFEFLVNFIGTTIEVDNFADRVSLLSYTDVYERAMALLKVLDTQVELLKIKQEINQKVKSDIDQQQREYYLNNQLKTIQEALGMDEEEEFAKLRAKADGKKWSKEVREIFDREMQKLEKYNPSSPDYSIQYNYIQFMLDLPWGECSEDNLDLANAQKVLDEDHFGLENVKDRIIEYLAVLKLKGNMKSPILCLYGPPGVGKTSLGKSIADALHREYARISLGGLHDEAEIRGHRRTYIGAMPGRIIAALAKCGSNNPVIVLDEIDKVGQDFKGDPSSALLEVLDPEQNGHFHDNYLDVDYDLSKILFIATANSLATVSRPLLDRMEVIEINGYIPEEKLEIAKRHLLPKELEENGFKKNEIKFGKQVILKIIDDYTRESGVRQLEKKIATVLRRIARHKASGDPYPSSIKIDDLKEYLGAPDYSRDKYEGNEFAGVVTGLAWTAVGGEILFVESSLARGKGEKLTLTGNLGDVMKESAVIALQYLRSHCSIIGIDPELFDKYNIHIHVPEGAIPKDGPSAGVTMVTSLASSFTQRKVRDHLAMTGEITLRGKVLPVGGIKDKILAAKRSGITDIILCKDNRKDIEEINAMYLNGLTFHYVNTIKEVLDIALLPEKVKDAIEL